jgi:Max protein
MNMSEDEREIDVESEDEDGNSRNGSMSTLDKRAHHNALERKRRDHIKDSFTGLRDAIPTMRGGDKSSRAQILKKASEYIQYMRRKNSLNQNDLDDLKRQNSHLEAQIRALERAKTAGNFSSAADILSDQGLLEEGESLPTDLGTSPAVRTAIAPGQSLLLTSPDNTADPPKKKVKQL